MSSNRLSDPTFRNDDSDKNGSPDHAPSTKNPNDNDAEKYSEVEITFDNDDSDEDEEETPTPCAKTINAKDEDNYSNVEITFDNDDDDEEDPLPTTNVPTPDEGPDIIIENQNPLPKETTIEHTQNQLNDKFEKIKLPSILYFIIGLLACLIAFYIYTETLGILKSFRHSMFFPGILGGFILIGVLIIFFATKIWIEIYKICKFKVNPQINIKALEEISKNQSDQLKYMQIEEALRFLYDYVKAYPEYQLSPQKPALPDLFSKWGEEELADFNLHRQEILNGTSPLSGFDMYLAFQNRLDEIARDRVNYIAIQVAYQTALSPRRLFDILIAAYWSFRLLKEIAEIYNLKMENTDFLIITIKILSSVIIVGKVDDAGNVVEDTIKEQLQEYLPDLGATLLSSLTSKMAEGGINYLLMRRIGKAMIARLQPITND